MSTFSWIIQCNKIQWINAYGKHKINESHLYIKRVLFLVLIVLIEPKRTRVVGASETVIRESPITICIGKVSFNPSDCKVRGLAMFQPHQFFGLMFLIFAVCMIAQQGLAESILVSILISAIHGIAITINDAPSLHRIYYAMKHLFLL